MTPDTVFDLLNEIREEYIQEAAEETPARMKKPRLVLIAAVISLLLILAGCVAVYLGFEARKVGEIIDTQKVDDYGNPISPKEKQYDLLTMSGFGNSSAQQASREWYDFFHSYLPELRLPSWDYPDIPNALEYTYQCKDQTMVKTLEGIADKYHLKLLGTRCASFNAEKGLDALGITSLIKPDGTIKADPIQIWIHPPHNFTCDLRFRSGNVPWKVPMDARCYYLQSGYLAHLDTFLYDLETTTQWEFTTQDGTPLQLALSSRQGIILYQGEAHTFLVLLDLDGSMTGAYLDGKENLVTQELLETIAESFDYSIKTKELPMDGIQALLGPNPELPVKEPGIYESIPAYLDAECLYPEKMAYALYDVDADGEQEILIGYEDETSVHILKMADGIVKDLLPNPARLGDGNVLEVPIGRNQDVLYLRLEKDKAVPLQSIQYQKGSWYLDQKPVEAETIQKVKSSFTPKQLTWIPLTEYPMEKGKTTFGDLLQQEASPTGEALLDFYRENLPETADSRVQYYLLDLNGDGIEDLLAATANNYFEAAYTCKRGKLQRMLSGFTLCDGGPIHSHYFRDDRFEGWFEDYFYFTLDGDRIHYQAILHHSLRRDAWMDDTKTEISTEEAQRILDDYHQETEMRNLKRLFQAAK